MKLRSLPAGTGRMLLISGLGVVWVALIHGPAIGLWWAWDDLHYLLKILNHSPKEYFFDPGFWKNSPILFTPLNILPYEINHYLFGLEPSGFYLHQLVAAWLLFLATVFFLRLWCRDFWAVAGAVLASASAPVLITVYQLMCVHYLVGLLLSVLAAFLYVYSLRQEKPAYTVLGAALYLLACSAKEIYIPLIVLLPFWPERSWRHRWRYWAAYAVAFAIYFVWRSSMLGLLASGYGAPVGISSLISVPWVALTSIFGGGLQGTAGAVAYLALLVLAGIRGWSSLGFASMAASLLVAPLLPIAFRLWTVDRVLVLISWVICASLAFLLDRLSRASRPASVLAVVILGAIGAGVVEVSWATRDRIIKENHRYRKVGEYVLTKPDTHALVLTGNGFRAREGKRLRRLTTGQDGPGILYDPKQFATLGAGYQTLHWFDTDRDQLMDISGPDPEFIEAWARRVREQPLSLAMEKRDGVVSWEFGPYLDSRYDVVYLSTPFAFNGVHYVGRYPAPIPAMDFVLRYQSLEGWITYSDVLYWQSLEGETLSWSRSVP